jgi:signal peptidase I
VSAEARKQSSEPKKRRNLLIELVTTLEWLTTAFMLAFVFRAFVMEAFRIPTGSMADTLKGAHFRLQCPECGYYYEFGFVPESYGLKAETVPANQMPLSGFPPRINHPRCPSCGYFVLPSEKREVYNGDRILVLKCIYQLFQPQRWDVVVFKNPLEPKVSFIKRLVGLPGETVEIIDGDVYIDGQIVRKPPRVQEELWSVVYDNDYQPVHPEETRFNNRRWKQPFVNTYGSKWQIDPEHPSRFVLESPPDEVSTLRYNTAQGNNLRAGYSYNSAELSYTAEFCSDLKVRFYVSGGREGKVGAALSKYGSVYRGYVDFQGELAITRSTEGKGEEYLVKRKCEPFDASRVTRFSFANVDHRLVLEFGGERLVMDMGRGPDSMGPVPQTPGEAEAAIFGSGKLTLSHVGLFRDIHYISVGNDGRTGRGCRGHQETLGRDEFFMLGDNSPASSDCRWWPTAGTGNNGREYRAGIVPRDYLVGKAVFVYWPSGYSIFGDVPFPVVPDFGRLRLIYGGSDRDL